MTTKGVWIIVLYPCYTYDSISLCRFLVHIYSPLTLIPHPVAELDLSKLEFHSYASVALVPQRVNLD